jgi:hypothetical protein
MGADFQTMLQDPETPTDPALVVDAMAELLAMPPGTRPLRTVVGMDFGVRDRNADDARHDAALADAFGLTEFAALAASAPGANGRDDGRVTFEFDQSATGPGTFAGTFKASGAISDTGTTEDALDVSSAEGANPMVATFRRTVTGENGTLVLVGDATVDLADPAKAPVSGTWRVESGAGAYDGRAGSGALSGTADFTADRPRARLRYDGALRAGA